MIGGLLYFGDEQSAPQARVSGRSIIEIIVDVPALWPESAVELVEDMANVVVQGVDRVDRDVGRSERWVLASHAFDVISADFVPARDVSPATHETRAMQVDVTTYTLDDERAAVVTRPNHTTRTMG